MTRREFAKVGLAALGAARVCPGLLADEPATLPTVRWGGHDLSRLLLGHKEHLTGMLQRLVGESIKLTCHFTAGLPNIQGDPCSLEQIIMNLAVNARDAMPHGGELTIAAAPEMVGAEAHRRHVEARPGRFVKLSVADTGSGIDAGILDHIFEPFFTTKEVGKGSGLGLSTVHGIVKQHEGWIEVSSQVGRGTTFSVFFPVSDQTAQAPAAPAPRRPATRASETLLVVEDEPVLRELACTILRQHGYHIYEAGNGPEALAIWAAQRPEIDLLLTDLVMPGGLSGGQLAKQLRKQNPDLKIVYISGYSPETAGSNLLHLHDASPHFLQKPFKPELLLQVVRECLEHTR